MKDRIAKLTLVALVAATALVGCDSGGSADKAPTKDDFKKTAPPPDWRGPGQPGGPPPGATTGPAAGAAPPAGMAKPPSGR